MKGWDKNKKYYSRILTNRQFIMSTSIFLLWILMVGIFVKYWLSFDSVNNFPLYWVNTVALFWYLITPLYIFYFSLRMIRFDNTLKIPKDWKVAMIVTKAPSEPFDMVTKTLIGMLKQQRSHDTWLADEAPTNRMKKWCKSHGVRLCSRYGVKEYQNKTWPRRMKCKEGNLAYFYDKFGYDRYDFVVQLDADHIPQNNYLESMIRPFLDAEVGYVSAPSVCNSNKESWATRARCYSENMLHGAIQAGATNGFIPFCVGSHYAVRTSALKAIGGLGPELAEDHTTTLMMQANGYRGVHAIDAIAYGDGPITFSDLVVQEYQWAKGLFNVFLKYSFQYLKKLPWNLKLQVIFLQLWYPITSIMFAVGFIFPILSISLNKYGINFSYLEFTVYYSAPFIIYIIFVKYIKSLNLLRPIESKVISWEVMLFELLRWPWVIIASLSALIDYLKKEEFIFKVTPKGKPDSILDINSLVPNILLIIASSIVLYLSIIFKNANHQHFFILLFLIANIALIIAVIFLEYYERNRRNSHSL